MMQSVAPLALISTPPPPDPFVLAVDDHEPSLIGLQRVIESAGYSCLKTLSAPEALVLCDSMCPSLVVTDLAMPRLDGHALALWLKARYPSVPILLLTGEMLDCTTKSALNRTFEAVLSKPLQVESFLTLLDRLMPPSARRTRPSS
jgi:CheY-like chemotaxis protein